MNIVMNLLVPYNAGIFKTRVCLFVGLWVSWLVIKLKEHAHNILH